MHISDITVIGSLHSVACVLAFFAGAHNLFAAKGTARHPFVGLSFFWSMIVLNLSSLVSPCLNHRFNSAKIPSGVLPAPRNALSVTDWSRLENLWPCASRMSL